MDTFEHFDADARLAQIFELESLLSALELIDVEQIDPSHHQQLVRMCIKKLREIRDQTTRS